MCIIHHSFIFSKQVILVDPIHIYSDKRSLTCLFVASERKPENLKEIWSNGEVCECTLCDIYCISLRILELFNDNYRVQQ